MSIDEQVVYSGPGGKPFNQIRLVLFGPGGGVAVLDDFSFEAGPRPAAYLDHVTNCQRPINLDKSGFAHKRGL